MSVIIPTRDRPALLERVLVSLAEQASPPEYEVWVVDNAGSAETAAACRRYVDRLPNLEYTHEARPGLHAARHAGLRLARGEIIVYTDDDVRAFPTWLAALDRSFRDASVWMAGGKCVPDYEAAPPAWIDDMWSSVEGGRALYWLSLVDLGDQPRPIASELVFGCNFAIRRDRLREIGGFHPDGMPEALLHLRGDGETAVSRAVTSRGGLAWYDPEASVHHWVPASRMTLAYVAKRGQAQGISDAYTLLRKRNGAVPDSLVRGLVRFARQSARDLPSWLPGRARGEAAAARRALRRGYWRGFFAQLARAARDPALREWTTRPSYLDS